MKLVANKPCNLKGKKYFIGEEVPVEEVVDYASLVKMGLLSVIMTLFRRIILKNVLLW